MFNRASHIDILVLSIFITDFSILALMFTGVLRPSWRDIRNKGGTWWVLYTQASLHHIADNLNVLRYPDLSTHH